MKKILFATLILIAILCVSLTSCDLLPGEDQEPNEVTGSVVTVVFDPDGGSEVLSQKLQKGEKLIKTDDPTKEGYVFEGWYLGDEKWSYDNVVTEDITLKAKWSVRKHTVKFLDEDGDIITTQKVAHGDKAVMPETPYNPGCTLVGWFANGMMWDFDTPITKNVTLSTKWVTFVVYHLDGGYEIFSNPSQIYSDDDFPIYLNNPYKSGYTFAGWYTDDSFTNRVYSISGFAPHTLYALWIEDQVTPPGGGGGTDDPPTDSEYPWSKTTIRIQISENSDSWQLPSTSRRYLAGDIAGYEYDYAKVDDYVKNRNDEAEKVTNVKATYHYLPDTANYGWGQCIDFICEQVYSGDPEAPDVFVNFVYDMVAASLRGSFANLYSTTMYEDGHELAGIEHNYFEFVNDVMYADTGEDYMYNYMRSLTLSKWKMYCLSSDYFIDAVRASLVIPVNIELLEMLPNGETEYDYDENGYFSIDEFYELVWNMDWTYETLADLSDAITHEQGGDAGTIDLNDRVGFALGTGSYLPAAAMLYSSSINIIQRTYDPTKCDYTYSYPSMKQTSSGDWTYDGSSDYKIEAIDNFLHSLSDLVQHDGVITTSSEEAAALGYTKGESQAIRERFASSNILFGGIITLGSLEYEEYLDMKGTGKKGYGIVPIPLYRSDSDDRYNTQIHSNGKIGAISYTTRKFAQCTAYLNYQSTHSSEILKEYFSYTLDVTTSDTDTPSNTEMLTYIREHVGSSLDKVFEDALAEFYWFQTGGTHEQDKWHTIIKNNNFEVYGFMPYYMSVVPAKAERLSNLEDCIYPSLPI